MGNYPKMVSRKPESQRKTEEKARAKVLRDGPFRVVRSPRLCVDVMAREDAEMVGMRERRESEVGKIKVAARVMVGGKEVATTRSAALSSEFTADINDTVALQVFRWPEEVNVQVKN